MDIYSYREKDISINSGKLIHCCDSKEYLWYLEESNATAVFFAGDEDDISGTCICLGDFDGVHIGHRALFEAAKKHGKWGALIFDRNIKGGYLLTTLAEKLRRLEAAGADYVVIATFCEKFSQRTPEEFVKFLKNTLCVDAVVAGYDYRFGHKAAGDTVELLRLCGEQVIEVEIIEPVTFENEPVKSTKIRELIRCGDIERANRLLGYNYSVFGEVIKGLQNGIKMGFPTANVSYDCDKLLPPDGVYYGSTEGNRAVINIGKNPTFNAEERTLEAHIIDYYGDLYGSIITVEFIEKIRDDIKFDDINELIKKIQKDVEYVKGRG